MNISACVFIKDTIDGAFCLFESLASILSLPQVTEYIILDLGSTDGTYQLLQEIAAANPKIKLHTGDWPSIDAGAFAKLANDLVAMCSNDIVWYHQADEIWHEDLLPMVYNRLEAGQVDLAFWRIQYRENWQTIKWYPHLIHRIGLRNNRILLNEGKMNFEFNGDGMNTTRMWDAKICSGYGGEYFPKWGEMGPETIKPYINQMVMDVSLVGGFLDNIIERKTKHAPFWHETASIDGAPVSEWVAKEKNNQNWYKTNSPYNIPKIMHYHFGKQKYEVRRELIEAIKADNTAALVDGI